MDELYRVHYSSISSLHKNNNFLGDGSTTHHQNMEYGSQIHDHDHDHGSMERSDVIKAQIANHPLYPTLLSSFIDCRKLALVGVKVGAPPEMASVLEEIGKENQPICESTEIGKDPELDHFMKSYCDALHKCKEELSKPFDEATNFLSSIGSQLTHLCNQTQLPLNQTEWGGGCGTWEEGGGGEARGRVEWGDEDFKEMLMRKYSGYVSSLRKELLKKRKKGKLPNHAISALFDWWNSHYKWPYPTEEEKNMLSEITGLEQKQINNWFINQRKRHWSPSDDMRFALMEGVAVDVAPST